MRTYSVSCYGVDSNSQREDKKRVQEQRLEKVIKMRKQEKEFFTLVLSFHSSLFPKRPEKHPKEMAFVEQRLSARQYQFAPTRGTLLFFSFLLHLFFTHFVFSLRSS